MVRCHKENHCEVPNILNLTITVFFLFTFLYTLTKETLENTSIRKLALPENIEFFFQFSTQQNYEILS